MSTCRLCGGALDFHTSTDGRRVPIHQSGRCVPTGDGTSRWGCAEAVESACFLTHCPEGCGNDVFFIRHNGGSIWTDPPLGWPWVKHHCMYPDDYKSGSKLALATGTLDRVDSSASDLILAVATAVEFSIDWSEWRLISGDRDEWRLHTNGDCRFLAGELVVLDLVKRILTPFYRRDLVFRVMRVGKAD
jgi:hypothetical protein